MLSRTKTLSALAVILLSTSALGHGAFAQTAGGAAAGNTAAPAGANGTTGTAGVTGNTPGGTTNGAAPGADTTTIQPQRVARKRAMVRLEQEIQHL